VLKQNVSVSVAMRPLLQVRVFLSQRSYSAVRGVLTSSRTAGDMQATVEAYTRALALADPVRSGCLGTQLCANRKN